MTARSPAAPAGSPPSRTLAATRRAGAVVAERVVRPAAARQRPLDEPAVLVLLLCLGAAAALACAALTARVYVAVRDGGALAGLDHPALDAAKGLRSPGLDRAVTAFTDLGGPRGFPLVAAVLVAAACLALRSWEPVVLAGVGLPVALGTALVGKDLTGRARPSFADAVPPYEHTASFPSGHAIMSTTLMALLGHLAVRRLDERPGLRRLVCAACALWALAMGLSRVFLGHHWLSDVAAGWALGLGWALVVATVHQAWLWLREASRDGDRQRGRTPPDGPAGGAPGGSGPGRLPSATCLRTTTTCGWPTCSPTPSSPPRRAGSSPTTWWSTPSPT